MLRARLSLVPYLVLTLTLAACDGDGEDGSPTADAMVDVHGADGDVAGTVDPVDAAADTAQDAPVDVDGADIAGDTAAPPDDRCGGWLPLQLTFSFDGREGGAMSGDAAGTWRGEAEVLAPGGLSSARDDATRIVRFRRVDDGSVLAVRYRLPHGWALPLVPGERLTVDAQADNPWWANHWLTITAPDGAVRARLRSAAASTLSFVATCPPVEDECEIRQSGSLAIPREGGEGEDVLYPGELAGYEGSGGPWRAFLARAYEQREWFCTDQPPGWLARGALHQVGRSQCRCAGDHDCATGELCETEIGRCVRDRCADGGDCGAEDICDPYRGCVPAPDGAACATTADCPADTVCNEPLGRCVPNLCVVADCAEDHRCSPLLGACRRCLADCDCGPLGACVEAEDRCAEPDCPAQKVGLTTENPDRHDFFVVCIGENVGFEELELRRIAPDIRCTDDPSPFCGDLPSVESCTGQLFSESAPPPTIAAERMESLCRLAAFPWVSGVVGGHYVK